MEKVSEFLNHLKERLSSPLFYSFIISWFFWNWKVAVALIWFDPPSNANGHLSLIEYISTNTNNDQSIICPLLSALLYTVASPLFSNLTSALRAWYSKWGESLNLWILKGSKIPIDKYFALRRQYLDRSKVLEETISGESATIDQLRNMETSLLDTRNQLNKTSLELSEVRAVVDNYNNTGYIDGKWIRTTEDVYDHVVKQNIEFRNGTVYEHDGIRQTEKYSVHNYSYNSRNKRLSFTLFHFGGQNKNAGSFFSFNDLEYGYKEFAGTEYQNGKSVGVKYERSPDIPNQEASGAINESSNATDESDAKVNSSNK